MNETLNINYSIPFFESLLITTSINASQSSSREDQLDCPKCEKSIVNSELFLILILTFSLLCFIICCIGSYKFIKLYFFIKYKFNPDNNNNNNSNKIVNNNNNKNKNKTSISPPSIQQTNSNSNQSLSTSDIGVENNININYNNSNNQELANLCNYNNKNIKDDQLQRKKQVRKPPARHPPPRHPPPRHPPPRFAHNNNDKRKNKMKRKLPPLPPGRRIPRHKESDPSIRSIGTESAQLIALPSLPESKKAISTDSTFSSFSASFEKLYEPVKKTPDGSEGNYNQNNNVGESVTV